MNKDLRGNVPTRIAKLSGGQYDAIFLASAGVRRLKLDLTGFHVVRLDPTRFVPSPGQGALAIQMREDDAQFQVVHGALHDEATGTATALERSVQHRFGGGCGLPLGAYALRNGCGVAFVRLLGRGSQLTRYGRKSMPAGRKRWLISYSQPLKGFPPMTPRVLITRDMTKAKALVQALQDYGFEACVVPVTKTVYLHSEHPLPEPEEFNWVAFTSATAVEAFALAMEDTERGVPQRPKLAAVGPATAVAVRQRLRDPQLVASGGGVELADALLEEEKGHTDWSVLWPCAQEPLPEFPQRLEAAGVKVEPWSCLCHGSRFPPTNCMPS